MYGVTDGRAFGTYLEHKFRLMLEYKNLFRAESSARRIDFPEPDINMKVTSIKQPQSSSPFKSARQKIHGHGLGSAGERDVADARVRRVVVGSGCRDVAVLPNKDMPTRLHPARRSPTH